MEDKKIGVGFGILVLRDGRVLLGRRNDDPEKASSELHGEGTWTMPGGKLHFGESFEEGCLRELTEETGILANAEDLKFISLSNDMARDEAHFVTAGFVVERFQGEPQIMEPDEIIDWRWFPLSNVPENLFLPSRKVLNNYLADIPYSQA